MASGGKKEDDEYAMTLQQLMKDCLPPILVEVVEKRPGDPIEHIAHCLYKYRGKELDKSNKPISSHAQLSTHTTVKNIRQSHPSNKQRVLLVDDETDDDFLDTARDLHIQKVLDGLHIHCISVLNNEDMFDDDDLS